MHSADKDFLKDAVGGMTLKMESVTMLDLGAAVCLGDFSMSLPMDGSLSWIAIAPESDLHLIYHISRSKQKSRWPPKKDVLHSENITPAYMLDNG